MVQATADAATKEQQEVSTAHEKSAAELKKQVTESVITLASRLRKSAGTENMLMLAFNGPLPLEIRTQ